MHAHDCWFSPGTSTLQELREAITAREITTFQGQAYKLQNPNLKTLSGRLYSTAAAFEAQDKGNLQLSLEQLGQFTFHLML